MHLRPTSSFIDVVVYIYTLFVNEHKRTHLFFWCQRVVESESSAPIQVVLCGRQEATRVLEPPKFPGAVRRHVD